jgi:hypothetical protein
MLVSLLNQQTVNECFCVDKPSNTTYKLWSLAATLQHLDVHDFFLLFFHHAARTLSRLPHGLSNQAYLSLHTSEATSTKIFRACSSPTPTQTKPQPTPAKHTMPRVSPDNVVNHSSRVH